MSLTIIPFQDEHLDTAAQLLAARHRRDRLALPQMPMRFEEPSVARQAIEPAWRKPWSSGAIAFDNGIPIGYLFGTPQFDAHMGRTAWVRPAGYALAAGVNVEVMRDLYAFAGTAWVEMGCFDHYAMSSTADRSLLDAWYSLDFGQQHAYGLLDLKDGSMATTSDAKGIVVRRANANDGAHLVGLCYITGEHQFYAPTWAPTPQEIMAGRPKNYNDVAGDEEAITWLAFKEDDEAKCLGYQIYHEAEPAADDLYVPKSCIELSSAGTAQDVRGQGIGTTLTNVALSHAHDAGYACCLTDWRTTNLQSSRFWPQKGFEPVVYRLHRHVDERIMWANKIR